MCVLHPIIHMIILMDTFVRGCFMLVGAFSKVTQELISGVLDIDWKKKVVEIPNLSTCATVVAETILRITTVSVRACANGFLSLAWPTVDLEAIRAGLQAYAKVLMAIYGPRKTLPASPTWPSSTMDSSKWIPSFGYGGHMSFASATMPTFPAIPLVWAHRIQFGGGTMPLMLLPAPPAVLEAPKPEQWLVFKILMELLFMSFEMVPSAFTWIIKPLFVMEMRAILRLVLQPAMEILVTLTLMSFEAVPAAVTWIIKPMFVMEMRAIFRLVLQPAVKILMALIIMSFEASRWILMAMRAIFRLVLQPMNRVFNAGRFVLFHRQRDDLDDNNIEEEEATDGDSFGTTETSSESLSDSLEENDPVMAALVESFGSLSL